MKSKQVLPTLLLVQSFIISSLLNVALAQSDYVEPGFLSDYSRLSAGPERPNVRLYIAPGANLYEYDKVFLMDVVLFLHPQSEYQGISFKKIAAVTDEFESHVRKNMVTRRELVDEVVVGEKTIILRLAISNVYAKRPKRGLVGYTPIGLAGTGAKKAAGRDYALSTAAFEGEMLDGETGEIIAAIVATQLGETLAKARTGERKWSDIQAYLRDYAETLSNRFD